MGINFNKAEFILSAVNQSTFIRDGRPQVAFAGRSNVGKSSVINRLLNRKNFARVGATPGKTTQVNYFLIDGKIYFTDLPGYGYAKVSKKEREKWGQMIETYLTSRETLRGVVILVDARHAPTKDDVAMYEWMRYYEMPLLVVATKSDKIPRGKWNKQESLIKKTLNFQAEDDFIAFSAKTKEGKDAVWQWIEAHTVGGN